MSIFFNMAVVIPQTPRYSHHYVILLTWAQFWHTRKELGITLATWYRLNKIAHSIEYK